VAAPVRATGAPFLRRIESLPEKIDQARFPFNIRAFSHRIDLAFGSKVTFFVVENGSGKSTLLEALAECCGFNPEGGNRDHHRATVADRSLLAQALRLTWRPKVTEGFFMRGELLSYGVSSQWSLLPDRGLLGDFGQGGQERADFRHASGTGASR
jgi:predicted ATPase